MNNEQPHNPYIPDENDPEHPGADARDSHISSSPVAGDNFTIGNSSTNDLTSEQRPPSSSVPSNPVSKNPNANQDIEEGKIEEVDSPTDVSISNAPTEQGSSAGEGTIDNKEPISSTVQEQSSNSTFSTMNEQAPDLNSPGAYDNVSPSQHAFPTDNQEPPLPPSQPPMAPPIEPEPDDEEEQDKIARYLGGAALLIAIVGLLAVLDILPLGKVDTSNIADEAVTNSKLATGAVSKDNLQSDALEQGPRGPAGATGPQGPRGARGPQGQPGLSNFRTVEKKTPLTSDASHTVNVSCPTGMRVLNAGVGVNGNQNTLTRVALQSSNAVNNGLGWEATAIETQNVNGNWSLEVAITCARFAQSVNQQSGNNQNQ